MGNRVYSSDTGSWQLNEYDSDGSLKKVFRYPIARIPVNNRLIDAEKHRLSTLADGPGFLRLFDRLELADSTSAIRRVIASSDGLLWVERWHPHDFEATEVWDVMSTDGAWLRTISIPAGAGSFLDAHGDRLLTVYHGDFDVPFVRVYRLPRGR
jgi:hypothetical protein